MQKRQKKVTSAPSNLCTAAGRLELKTLEKRKENVAGGERGKNAGVTSKKRKGVSDRKQKDNAKVAKKRRPSRQRTQ